MTGPSVPDERPTTGPWVPQEVQGEHGVIRRPPAVSERRVDAITRSSVFRSRVDREIRG